MKSLKFKLMVAFILLIVASFSVLTVILFHYAKTIISSYIEESALEKMNEYASYVEMLQNQVYDSATLVYNSEIMQEWERVHQSKSETDGAKMLENIDLSDYLTQVTNSYTPIANITVYRQPYLSISGEHKINRSAAYTKEAWYVNLTEKESYWSSAKQDSVELSKGNDDLMVSLTMPLDTYNPATAQSFLKINVSQSYFLEPLERLHLGETGQMYLIDRQGELLLTEQGQYVEEHQFFYFEEMKTVTKREGRLYQTSPSGDREMIVYKRLPKTKWIIVGIVSEQDLYSPLNTLRQSVVIIVSILLILSIIVTLVISYSISKPLNSLVAAMRHLKRGDFVQAENRISREKSNTIEIAFVIDVFKNMISQLKQYIAKEYQLNLLKQKAEYKALVMQINPHFLFNTLEMISSLALQNRTKETSKMISSLGHMMRYSLKVSEDFVYLQEELRFIGHYLDIIRVRYQNRSNISLIMQGELDNLLIVRFMLQPLIENAVKYSSLHKDFIEIETVITREDCRLVIVISDNGIGFTEDQKHLLKHQMSKQWQLLQDKDQQIGMQNVFMRCYAIYGEQFQFELATSRFGGAMVSLYVLIKEVNEHD